jgi:hypothetical protein
MEDKSGTAANRNRREAAMCFSAEASFGAAGALLAVGAYCVSKAIRKDQRFLPLALTPIAFGAQQAAEGFVWLGLHHEDAALVERGTVVFLFFALAFWPFWIPFSLLFPEPRRPAKVFLATTAILSAVWLVLYAPVALDPAAWHPQIMHHSLDYGTEHLPGFRVVPRIIWQVAYLAFIALPLGIARTGGHNWLRIFGGGAIALLFAVSYFVYTYAFTSVWCFFAAILSLALAIVFARLPYRAEQASLQRQSVGAAP